VADVATIVQDMRSGTEIHFGDLFKVCEHYFGKPRNTGSSHYIFKTPWPGDPRINIQNLKGKAKPYQIRQVLAAIDKLADLRAQAQKKSTETKPVITTAARKPPKKRP
jgi:hypothetical protein